jgi:hypothetical protein
MFHETRVSSCISTWYSKCYFPSFYVLFMVFKRILYINDDKLHDILFPWIIFARNPREGL